MVRTLCNGVSAAAAALGIIGSPALAIEKSIYPNMTGPQLAAILRDKGFQGELGTDTVGDPMINSSTSGNHFRIYFGGCDKADVRVCKSIQFAAVFNNDKNYTAADANKCNLDKMFGRAWTQPDTVHIDYGIPISGVDDDYIATAIDNWSVILANFQECILAQRK